MGMLVSLVVNAIAFYVVAYLIPGVEITGWEALLVVAVVWGIMAMLVRPLLVLLTLPVNVATLGLFIFVINALLLMLTARLVPGFEIVSFWVALLAAVMLSLVNMVLSRIR
ncbi:MAG: Membrane protein of unknown function [Microgenomates group bacterium ADurb.Bin238]|jgi:putative membrane protein|nr:MAG: Membrane protein of unknown function [Microgenomates group bacterium ADurb.Bin238]